MSTLPISNPISTPIGPGSVRVFAGYRLPTLSREDFFRELGQTFMPGTPCMLAPLGLAAYLPVVLDPEAGSGLPDEAALIVYASLDAYAAARRNSLEGRMYTHSHAGVFDMASSRGQWPGAPAAPDRQAGSERWSWYAFDRAVEWQQGSTRVLCLRATSGRAGLQPDLHALSAQHLVRLTEAGADQAIFLAAPGYAVIWIHGPTPEATQVAPAHFLPEGTSLTRDLLATPVPMPTRSEGVEVSGPGAYSFRFVRELRHFL
jgi:hypothetical protein